MSIRRKPCAQHKLFVGSYDVTSDTVLVAHPPLFGIRHVEADLIASTGIPLQKWTEESSLALVAIELEPKRIVALEAVADTAFILARLTLAGGVQC